MGDPGDETHANRGFNIHLGSTGCQADGKTSAPEEACLYPNTVQVCLGGQDGANFDAATNTVVFDVKDVLAESDVTIDEEAPAGCMSFPGDSACNTIMPRLNLPYAFSDEQVYPAVGQHFVRME